MQDKEEEDKEEEDKNHDKNVITWVKKKYFLDFLKPFKYEAILLKTLAIDIDNQNKNLWS